MAELSHLSEAGDGRMVDVGGKPTSRRRAVARGAVRMAPQTASRLRELPKGDALVTAQLAGIMAAKRTSELIPLGHPLPLSHIGVSLDVATDAVEITAVVETTAQTGVEMEALTAVSVAALTIYDGVAAGEREDESGAFLVELLQAERYDVEHRVVPDERPVIAAAIRELA